MTSLAGYYRANAMNMTKSAYGAGAATYELLPAKANKAYHLVACMIMASNNAANDGLQVQLSYTEYKKSASEATALVSIKLVPLVANSANTAMELNTLTTTNTAVNMVIPSGTFSLAGVTIVYREVDIDE